MRTLLFASALLLPLQRPTSPDQEARAEQTPAPPRGLVAHKTGALDGWTLFPPLRSRSTYLVDMEGKVVHEWKSEHPPGNAAYLLDDGRLLRCCRMDNDRFHGGGQGGRIQEQAWDGTVTWDYAISDEKRMQHHDIKPMPNGNVMYIAWEYASRDEAVALGRDAASVTDQGWWPDCIVEITPRRSDGDKPGGADVVWEWHARDHLVQDLDAAKPEHGVVADHPERIDINADRRAKPVLSDEEKKRQQELDRQMRQVGYTGGDEHDGAPEGGPDGAPAGAPGDGPPRGPGPRGGPRDHDGDWLHTNSLDYDARLDLVLLSVHNLDEIWVIDHSTKRDEAASKKGGKYGHGGDLLYRWGNPSRYGRGTNADRRLFQQHDASWMDAGGEGALRVLVFNNGEGRPGDAYSSVDEIELPFDRARGFALEGRGAFGPKEATWSYSAPVKSDLFSSFISGTQRLANGNTLIINGVQGRIFEVTRAGEVVWDYLNPFGGEVEMGPPGGRGPRPDGAPPRRDGAPDGRSDRDPRGGPPRDGGGDGPPVGGPPPGGPDGRGPRGGPPGMGGRGPGGPGGLGPHGLFRATRIPANHPWLREKLAH